MLPLLCMTRSARCILPASRPSCKLGLFMPFQGSMGWVLMLRQKLLNAQLRHPFWCRQLIGDSIQWVCVFSDSNLWLLQIMRSRLSRHYGYEVTTEGDAFLMVGPRMAECMLLFEVSALMYSIVLLQAFYEASDAVSWAVETQQVSCGALLASVSMQLSCTSCCQAII